MFDDLPDPRQDESTEVSDTSSADRRKEFERLSRKGPADADAERAFLESKIELIRSDPHLSDEERNHAVTELQHRLRALTD